jgi:GMP synthase-like glutamine amidotransferase
MRNRTMTKLLVLNHHGLSIEALVGLLASLGADVDLIEPESIMGKLPVREYDGVVASGGYLKSATRQETLRRYSSFFEELDSPYLGICLGMKILGFCYGARIGKTPPVVGESLISLRGFPLSPSLGEFKVHQNHKYQLLPPLPRSLENFTAEGQPIQAVKVMGRDLYAVQFHPEVGDSPARVIVANFVSMCSGRR